MLCKHGQRKEECIECRSRIDVIKAAYEKKKPPPPEKSSYEKKKLSGHQCLHCGEHWIMAGDDWCLRCGHPVLPVKIGFTQADARRRVKKLLDEDPELREELGGQP